MAQAMCSHHEGYCDKSLGCYTSGMETVIAPEKPKVVKVGEKKDKERDAYALWLSIPAMLRMLPDAELKKMGYDADDPVFKKLMAIKTKGDFCREMGIGINSPARWEAEPEFMAKVNALSTNDHVLKFKKDVDFSFTQKVLKHGDAQRMKLWKQVFEGWSEKIEHKNTNLNIDVVGLVQEIEARNAKLRA